MKQVTLLVLTNLAVLTMLSALLAVLRVLGIIPPDFGLASYTGMLVLSMVMGFGGAFLSLAMSKSIAKRSVGAQVITQIKAVLVTLLWSGIVSYALFMGIKLVFGIRPTTEDERQGLDQTSHGESAYNY